MNKKILITGGAGFLGINLIRYLLKYGYRVRSLDFSEFNYPEKDCIDVVLGDIRDREIVDGSMKGIDIVIHAAAALPLYSRDEIYSTDVQGGKNVLDSALKNKVEKFINISSTAVYGIPDHYPIFETDKLEGVGPYGEAKILFENICLEYRKKGMCISIIRPKSFIGPERLGVFSLFYEWAKDGKNFPVIGSGNNKYQLLDVEDLCQVIHLCVVGERSIVNDTFNVGAKEFTTMKEDYQAVLNEAGFGKKIIGFPAWLMVPVLHILDFFHLSPLYKWVYKTAGKDSFVSVGKAEGVLGYKPEYSNKDALIRNYKWYIKNIKNFENQSGISHRVPWKQGILRFAKIFF